MRKGEQTREMILERAAELFNQQGYFGTSLSDLMRETGLEKGGIYNHFRGKDELAIEAFEYACKVVWQSVEEELVGKVNAVDRLLAMLAAYCRLIDNPTLPGGCPVLNTAVESDDAHPALAGRARWAMTRWRRWIHKTVSRGIAAGEIGPETDVDTLASVIIATIEGAVMLSKLYDDPVHIYRAVDHLTGYINTIRA
ncbi:MAG TPA: TetR/AcrR family transcriptional regulator [Ktedonobacteraceae bacterium]|nr:TetR/AcrR family transcriptional regulator [Ktedonobacteraceae bacterium]